MVMKILVTDQIHGDGLAVLRGGGLQVDEAIGIGHDELIERVSGYDAIIVRGRVKVTREVIKAGGRLKVIGRAGVGLDNIDLQAAQEAGVKVVSTPEASSVSVAEHVFALILALFRKIPVADRSLKEGMWAKDRLIGKELRGKTLGIVGLGRIGVEVAKRAKAFEMNVIAYGGGELLNRAKRLSIYAVGSLDELLQKSDIVSLHVPLTPETCRMIGEGELRKMRRGAYLINTSRGRVVDGEAVLKALKDGRLAGAALDVYEHEPPYMDWELELIKLNNVICTPHIGGSTEEAQREASIMVARRIIELLKSRAP